MACPGVDKDKVYLIGAGNIASLTLPAKLKEGDTFRVESREMRIGKMTLPEGLKPEDVTLSSEYGDKDEDMKLVREVNEDPHDVLKMTIRKTIPAYVDRITLSFEHEEK